MNTNLLKKTLPICFNANVTPVLVGIQGVGKSQSIHQCIEGEGIGKVYSYHLSQVADVGDLIGLLDMAKSDDYCQFKIPKRIHDMIKYCEDNPTKYGVLFFDEMNRGTKDLLQAVFEVVLEKRLNGTQLPTNLKCVAAINPATDDFTVLDFDDAAFNDRFAFIKFEPAVKAWLDYARQQGVNGTITSFIEENNNMLDPKNTMDSYEIPADKSRRTWMAIDRVEKQNPEPAVFQELLIGMVGMEPAGMYLDHCKKYNQVIKGTDILNKYKSVKTRVVEYSNPNSDRTDILNNACDRVIAEIKGMTTLNKTQEKNLSEFICDIPRELSSGLVQTLFDFDAFLSTASDDTEGMAGGKFAASKRLLDNFKGWDAPIVSEEETAETAENGDNNES